MPAPATSIATLVAVVAAHAGCGEPAPSVRLVPIDRACGRVLDARALLVTPLGALTSDRQLVQAGAPVVLSALPAETRQLAVEVVGEGGVIGAIGKTAPFELGALADGDILTVAMGAPDGVCPAGALHEPRAHAAVAQAGDAVLLVGGASERALATAELYDPAHETSRTIAVPAALTDGALGLSGAALARMPDGRVVLVGGPQRGYAVFDPAAGGFGAPVLTGAPRAHHAAIALDDRRLLLVGGCSALAADGACAPGSAETATLVVDTGDGHVSAGPALQAPRIDPAIVVEHGRDGRRRLIVVGGRDPAGLPVTRAERLDPEGGDVEVVEGTGDAATVLDSGAILTAFAPAGLAPAANGAVIVPGVTAARPVPSTPARAGARLVTLEDGEVLAVGGGPLVRYQPAAGAWRGVPGGAVVDVDDGAATLLLPDGSVLVAGGRRAGAAIGDVWRFRPRLLGPYGAAVSVVPGDPGSEPPLTPLDPERTSTTPRWQVADGSWAIVGGMIGDDLRLAWTGELPADGAALLFGFVDAGRHHRADLVPGRPVAVVSVLGGQATVRCEGAPAPAAGPIVARVELARGAVQVLAGGRTLLRCPLSGQSGAVAPGRVGIGALGAGAVTIETLAVTR